MVTCEEIQKVAYVIYPSSVNPGWFDISPPVRVIYENKVFYANMVNLVNEEIRLVGMDNTFAAKGFEISDQQGRIPREEITDNLLDDLEKLLNQMANEKIMGQQTSLALFARNTLDKFGLTRHK